MAETDFDEISTMKVALIGCGPGGMNFLHAMKKRKTDGKAIPDVTCFERAGSAGVSGLQFCF